ncbi:MAG TPA: thioredoxin domain-containing protein [Planctomycetes bacterium]|nr:thioredoxin domain-containing protein [Planctomycetota bacterium]
MTSKSLSILLVLAVISASSTAQEPEKPRHTNALIHSKSPYLLQHAHNPVDWHPWGDAAFAEAKRRGVPVFLSIGYSTCHWCHVMERESFENEEIASFLNEHFVCIKLDREERPDVDAMYMRAVQAFNQGRGGWPASLFLTPERKPFFGGTYFPPKAFKALTAQVAEIWKNRRSDLEADGDRLVAFLRKTAMRETAKDLPPANLVTQAAEGYFGLWDKERGGFGGAPKFPRTSVHELLLRFARDENRKDVLEAATSSLLAMSRGGIRDQIGGGFHRYSTDANWLVPHFEKMLYDQALVASSYLDAGLASGDTALIDVARDTLDAMIRDFQGPEGGFFVGYDADAAGKEGLFYVWSIKELKSALDKDEYAVVASRFGPTETGNWSEYPGRNILAVQRSWEAVAKETGFDIAKVRRVWAAAREKLRAARSLRTPPALDDKVLSAWNGMAIEALARAGRSLDSPRYLAAARRAMQVIREKLVDGDGNLLRRYRDGDARFPATLADEAWAGRGALELYQATGEVGFAAFAVARASAILAGHRDKAGDLLDARKGTEDVLINIMDAYDGARPAPVSAALHLLLRVADLTGEKRFAEAADQALRRLAGDLTESPLNHPALLQVLADRRGGLTEVVVIAQPDDPHGAALRREVNRRYLPDALVLFVTPQQARSAEKLIPLLESRGLGAAGEARAYVCRGGVCKLPTSDPKVLAGQL